LRLNGNYKYCRVHRKQATNVPCGILAFPNEVLYKVLEYLLPHERVALALTCSNLAVVAKQHHGRPAAQQEQLQSRMSIIFLQAPRVYMDFTLEVSWPLPFPALTALTCPELNECQHFDPFVHITGATPSYSSDTTLIPACATCGSGRLVTGQTRSTWQLTSPPLIKLHRVYYAKTVRNYSVTWESGLLDTVMRKYPFLFGDMKESCSMCKQGKHTHSSSKASLVCRECYLKNARGKLAFYPDSAHTTLLPDPCEYFVRWCKTCQGEPQPLDIARMFWHIQDAKAVTSRHQKLVVSTKRVSTGA
jgi:hypothetical protein